MYFSLAETCLFNRWHKTDHMSRSLEYQSRNGELSYFKFCAIWGQAHGRIMYAACFFGFTPLFPLSDYS